MNEKIMALEQKFSNQLTTENISIEFDAEIKKLGLKMILYYGKFYEK
jgi:hypothetical protein